MRSDGPNKKDFVTASFILFFAELIILQFWRTFMYNSPLISASAAACKDPSAVSAGRTADKLFDFFKKLSIIALYVCEFAVIYNRSFEKITGPIMAVCMLFLIFTDYYYVPFTVILIPGGALGTVIMGKLSVYYLLFPLLILHLIITKCNVSFRWSDLVLFALGLFHIVHLAIFENYVQYVPKLVFMTAIICWFLYIRCLSRRDDGLIGRMLLSLAMTITVNAGASLLTGNYSKYESADRLGIAGIGGNDPNIAAFIIGIAVAVLLSTKLLKVWVKIPLLFLLFTTLITTVSISGMIGNTVIILSFLIFMNKNKRNFSVILTIILVAVIAIGVFPMLNIQSESTNQSTNYLEYYQEKINDKLGAVKNKNYAEATSTRSELLNQNLKYFSEQSAVHQLFGGNRVSPLNVNVSHNSFADILLRFGYVGFVAVILMLLYSTYNAVRISYRTGDCMLLLCKLNMLYWSFSLSLFEGQTSCMWFALLLIL